MDPASLMYSSACLQLAMQNGAYTVKNRSKDAVSISARFNEDSALSTLARQMTIPPVTGFWKNEQYTTLDMSATLDMLRTSNIRVYGLYGKEDGLYSEAQILNLKKSIGKTRFITWTIALIMYIWTNRRSLSGWWRIGVSEEWVSADCCVQ